MKWLPSLAFVSLLLGTTPLLAETVTVGKEQSDRSDRKAWFHRCY